MSPTGKTSKKIIDELLSSDERRVNKILLELHDHIYPKIRSYVLSNSGTAEDVADVVQDGLAALYGNCRRANFEVTSDIHNYLFGICKNTWLKKLSRKKRLPMSEFTDYDLKDEEADQNEEAQIALIADMMAEMPAECQKVLQWFYFNKLSMSEIAKRMNYNSEKVAKSKKYKCLQKLSSDVLNHPLLKELLS